MRPLTCCHVRPPSSERNRPAGSTPAYSAPLAGVTCHTARIAGPSSPYVRPSLECVHVAPRSSLRHTACPYHGLPAAARRAPSLGSSVTCWTGQPLQYGPLTANVLRSADGSSTKAPLRVPTRTSRRWATVISPCRRDAAAHTPAGRHPPGFYPRGRPGLTVLTGRASLRSTPGAFVRRPEAVSTLRAERLSVAGSERLPEVLLRRSSDLPGAASACDARLQMRPGRPDARPPRAGP